MKLVFICSPYQGDIEVNTIRARRYCFFAYSQGVVPFAPHLLFTQFLDENISKEREAGIQLGLEILEKCDEIWIFGNLLSEGMKKELYSAITRRKPIRYFNESCQEVKKMNT
jgi:hypothetical protein